MTFDVVVDTFYIMTITFKIHQSHRSRRAIFLNSVKSKKHRAGEVASDTDRISGGKVLCPSLSQKLSLGLSKRESLKVLLE